MTTFVLVHGAELGQQLQGVCAHHPSFYGVAKSQASYPGSVLR